MLRVVMGVISNTQTRLRINIIINIDNNFFLPQVLRSLRIWEISRKMNISQLNINIYINVNTY